MSFDVLDQYAVSSLMPILLFGPPFVAVSFLNWPWKAAFLCPACHPSWRLLFVCEVESML
jgi:hypothetical protein